MRKADYTVFVNIEREEFIIQRVLCKIYLPERLTDSIELRFFPSAEQLAAIQDPFEFSVKGEVKDAENVLQSRVESTKVYRDQTFLSYLPSDITEREIIGTPRDLEIEDFYKSEAAKSRENLTTGTFWLTPSNLLSPGKTLSPSYTGEVSVDLFRKLEFKLENGFQLAFDKYYRYKNFDNNDMVTFSELVAEFEFCGQKSEIKSNIEYIDDFLVLVSFAERQRCVCLGWEADDSAGHIRHYRREMAIPEKNDQEPDLTLISKKEFESFIHVAYEQFTMLKPRNLFREAIQKTIHRKGETIESNYMSLYSALETIVLFSKKKEKHSEFIFPAHSPEWKKISDDLKKWLKSHPLLKGQKDKRKLMYEKLNELNRASFRSGFERIIETLALDLNDLWPVLDRTDGVSLSNVRNLLVHGEVFDPAQYKSLIVASYHLRWIVERILLTILSWDVSRSTVRRQLLSDKIEFNKNWKSNREILSSKYQKV